jgi:hypothetical protein
MESMIDEHELLGAVDWNSVVRAVIGRGWCRVPGAVPAGQTARLIQAAPGPWHALPPDEGGGTVYQAGFVAFSHLDDSGPLVRGVAQARVISRLTGTRPAAGE